MIQLNTFWDCKDYNDLDTDELYAIMNLRQEVFVVEQNCPYNDADGKDKKSYHVMGYNSKSELVAYARIVKPGVSYKEVSIGRVVSKKSVRKTGIGIELMHEALKQINEFYSEVPVRISAQSWLLKFYKKFGFVSIGNEYLEDHIPHTEMLKTEW